MRILFFVFLFLFISALVIVSNDNLHLNSADQAKKFASLYYSWLLNMGNNAIKATGYVVGFQWLPNQNNTISTNSTK